MICIYYELAIYEIILIRPHFNQFLLPIMLIY
jgi:hypothetical protein